MATKKQPEKTPFDISFADAQKKAFDSAFAGIVTRKLPQMDKYDRLIELLRNADGNDVALTVMVSVRLNDKEIQRLKKLL
jgi:hypothetical protein